MNTEHPIAGQARCPYCQATVESMGVNCAECHALHHAHCYAENGGCAVLGCASAADRILAQASAGQVLHTRPVDESLALAGAAAASAGAIGAVPEPPAPITAIATPSWVDPVTGLPMGAHPGAEPAAVPAATPKWRQPRVLAGLGAAAALGLLAVLAVANAGPKTVEVDLSLTIDQGCYETGLGALGYVDISRGTTVRVEDGKGTVLGTGTLGAGTSAGYGSCKYTDTFTVDRSPDDTYRVTAGHAGRGYLTFDDSDVVDGVLEVDATFG